MTGKVFRVPIPAGDPLRDLYPIGAKVKSSDHGESWFRVIDHCDDHIKIKEYVPYKRRKEKPVIH